MAKTQQFCTFYLADQFFGVPVQQVQEVIRYQDMTRVPLVLPVIRGLINLRGQIVMAVDLRLRFDMPARPPGRLPMNVVVRTDDGAVSLLVDEIADVLEVGESSFEPPPDTLEPRLRQLVMGVHKLDGHLMHVLNTAAACASLGSMDDPAAKTARAGYER